MKPDYLTWYKDLLLEIQGMTYFDDTKEVTAQ